MNKTYIFTASLPDANKQIIYAQLTNGKACKDLKACKQLIKDFLTHASDGLALTADELEVLAKDLRKQHYAWFDDSLYFELTEVYG